MRTSAGFFDTGLSGKMRIQMRPPRLIWRVIARRAASICRDVSRPRIVAFRPYSPKLTLLPTVATPWSRPRSPRTLRRIRRRRRRRGGFRVVRHHLTLEDPHLDADDAIRRAGLREPVVDVGAQRVQRHASFAVP